MAVSNVATKLLNRGAGHRPGVVISERRLSDIPARTKTNALKRMTAEDDRSTARSSGSRGNVLGACADGRNHPFDVATLVEPHAIETSSMGPHGAVRTAAAIGRMCDALESPCSSSDSTALRRATLPSSAG